eukprot:TRINITY_DN1488_c0_g1_i7.p1 TRINITY_DN1488_c0_g1~~TRINITY_DN1488_c0_g1_i7.p1  ORF type:complete len:839 (-),score=183.11 TRINITY_DN1488_c0_g1_i7:3284-5632(-)
MDFVVSSTSVETALYDVYPGENILSADFTANYSLYLNQSRAQSYFFDRLAFAQRVRNESRSYFEKVSPINSSHKDYYVWTYGASYQQQGRRFEARVGWDIYSYPVFKADIDKAITGGQAWVTRTLFTSSDPFVAVFAPVFNTSFPSVAAENRSELCTGIFAGRIYVSNIVREALIDRDPAPVLIEVIDARAGDNVTFAYFGGQEAHPNYERHIVLDRRFVSTVQIDNGWNWSIRCTSTDQYSANHSVVWYWMFLICLSIFTASVMLAVYIQKDLTRVKRVEEEVQQRTSELKEAWVRADKMSKLAEKANDQKTKFVSFLCHELRTPLHQIVAVTGFLKEKHLDEDQNGFVMSLQTSASLMITIVNDVLVLEKVESGDMIIEHVPLDIRHLVQTICISQLDRCRKKGISLTSKFDDNLPVELCGDPTRISQILYNLTSNAIKFTEAGEVSIEVSGRRSSEFNLKECPLHFPYGATFCPDLDADRSQGTSEEHFWLVISVVDTGIGIEPQYFPKLFDAYTQEKLSTMRNYGGTGLGLAICKQLTGKMNGFIRVESEVNSGTCFTVILRLSQASCEQKFETLQDFEREPAKFSPRSSPKRIVLPVVNKSYSALPPEEIQFLESRLQGVRVLYADDQPINRKLMERFLKDCSPMLVCVENGLEAVRCVQEVGNRARQSSLGLKTLVSRSAGNQSSHSPSERIRKLLPENLLAFDVVLLDINMPVMDGKEAAGLIREVQPDIPIIAVSANPTNVDEQEEDVMLFNDYASKPIRRERLLEIICHWISR